MNTNTYIMKRDDIEKAFEMKDYIASAEAVFRLHGEGRVQMPAKVYLTFDKGDLRCMPAYLPSMNIAGVKNVSVHPLNRDLPVVMATITLFDPDTGFPLAIMDGTHITNMRTGAAGGVAAKYLSREDSRVAGFVGAGIQAWSQLEALLSTRPKIDRVLVYDISPAAGKKFAEKAKTTFGLEAIWTGTVKEAVTDADIVVTTTPVRNPIVDAEHIRNGTHINAIGADAPGKQELDPRILERARIVVDSWEQASHGGEINVALSKNMIARKNIHGEIGEVITGKKSGRDTPDQVTVFDSTGLAIQDISAAAQIYRRLISDSRYSEKMQQITLL